MTSLEGSQNQNSFPLPNPVQEEVEQYTPRHRADIPDITSEVRPSPEQMVGEFDERRFSAGALAEYLNPARAIHSVNTYAKKTFKEYWKAEVNGTITALTGAYLAHKYGGDMAGPWGNAAGATLGEFVGFYGTIFTQNYRKIRKDTSVPHTRSEATAEAFKQLDLLVVPEIVDNIFRVSIQGGAGELNQDMGSPVDPVVATGIGKFAADALFYGAIGPFQAGHERRKEARKARKAAKLAQDLEQI